MSSDEFELSAREVAGLVRKARSGDLSPEEIDNLWARIPRSAKVDFLAFIFEEKIVPHIQDIKQRAEDADPDHVRDVYAQQDEETKDDLFVEAIHDLLATFAEIREHPEVGLLNLKEQLRNPSTMEALLLIFDDEEHIDSEYSAEAKDFASWYVTAAGVALAPELYDEATVREVYDTFGLDSLPDE